jgi:hypothetical protein
MAKKRHYFPKDERAIADTMAWLTAVMHNTIDELAIRRHDNAILAIAARKHPWEASDG